jgi:hypothetical protein
LLHIDFAGDGTCSEATHVGFKNTVFKKAPLLVLIETFRVHKNYRYRDVGFWLKIDM